MERNYKRALIGLLITAFFIFTILVDTVGTSADKGASLVNPSAQSGKLLYQQFNCTSCQQLYGLGGYMGPDLTNEMSAAGKGETYARALLSKGTAKMPDFKLSPGQIDDLIAYLNYVDKTGISPLKNFKLNADGTFSILETETK